MNIFRKLLRQARAHVQPVFKCEVCRANPNRFRWLGDFGVAECMDCGAPANINPANDDCGTGAMQREWLPAAKAYWEATGEFNPSGLIGSGGDDGQMVAFLQWCDANDMIPDPPEPEWGCPPGGHPDQEHDAGCMGTPLLRKSKGTDQ